MPILPDYKCPCALDGPCYRSPEWVIYNRKSYLRYFTLRNHSVHWGTILYIEEPFCTLRNHSHHSLFIYGLGNLDFKHILIQLSTKFYISMQLSNNLVVKQCFKFFKYSDEFIKFGCLSRWRANLSFYAVNSHVYEEFKLSVL